MRINILGERYMENDCKDVPFLLISTNYPENEKMITDLDNHPEYYVRIMAKDSLETDLIEYSKYFHKAAHLITDFVLHEEHPDIGKLDTFIFPIAFLYRHCLELGLKAVGFQYIHNNEDRKQFIKETMHDLSELLKRLKTICYHSPNDKEFNWLENLFASISVVDKESDSFRYPFSIKWEEEVSGVGCYTIKSVFDDQISIDLIKFSDKLEAAYEIILDWYNKSNNESVAWKKLRPIFFEAGGDYYSQSVIGYRYRREEYYPYTKSYLECANFLKWFCKKNADEGNTQFCKNLFFPMCYLYRNCVELSLKTILFNEISMDFQTKCKLILKYKHSVCGLWRIIKPYILDALMRDDNKDYLNIIEGYCDQIHSMDGDANKFRYPITKQLQQYFVRSKKFDFVHVGDFFEELINGLDSIDYQLSRINELKAEIEVEYRKEIMID